MRIVVTEYLHPRAVDWLIAQGASVTLAYEGDAWEPVADVTRAIIVRSFKVDARLLDRMPALEIVGKQGVGVNTIDLDEATSRGVKVTNLRGINTNSVAEHAVAMLLAVARDLVACDAMVRQGSFADRFELRMMKELTESRLGLVGSGRIGRRVAEICRAGFGCAIGVYDPYLDLVAVDHIQPRRFDDVTELFGWADHVVVAAPLTEATRGLVDPAVLERLGPDGILVCSSRGGIVDEPSLAAAISAGTIRGAGVDVYDPEPPGPDGPLLKTTGTVLTPHLGGHSDKSRERSGMAIAEQVWSLLNGESAPLVGDEAWL
jgi:D-3-phosphoglycerate dehydrogenase